jgi:hypothetical protein
VPAHFALTADGEVDYAAAATADDSHLICWCKPKAVSGRHRADCPADGNNIRKRTPIDALLARYNAKSSRTHSPTGAHHLPPPIATATDAAALRLAPAAYEGDATQFLGMVLAARVPMTERLTVHQAALVAPALTSVLNAAAADNSTRAWTSVLLFAKLVLHRLPNNGNAAAAELTSRLRHVAAGRWIVLFNGMQEAATRYAEKARPNAAASHPVEDFGGRLLMGLDTDATVESIDGATLRRCERLIRHQQLAKAAASLSAAKVAVVDDASEASMREKHPTGPPSVPVPVLPRARPHLACRPNQATQALGAFPLGTAPGPSGLTAQHLLDCCAVPGSDVPAALAAVVQTLCAHTPPSDICPFLFGARLVALVKKDGGLRPIACGEVLRRLCGKFICAKHKDNLREMLLRCSQVGVGVPAGADAMHFAARDAAARVADGYAIVKLDFKNAFNEVHRSAVLAAVAKNLPDALPYAASAYSQPSWLLFGDRQLSSSQGVQQGDPLGPALFSLALADLWKRVPVADRDALDITAFFLDDGFLTGPPEPLARVVRFIEEEGPAIGVHLNRSKTEFIGSDADYAAHFAHLGRTPAAAWDLLGAPCGGDTHKSHWLARLEEKVRQRVRLIAALPPHPAFALLSKCGPSALTTFAARMLGPAPMFAALDEECRTAISKLVFGADGGLLDADVWKLAQLPIRFGGCGVRNTARHAAIAHVAAFRSALAHVKFLRRALLPLGERELEWIDTAALPAALPAGPPAPHQAAPDLEWDDDAPAAPVAPAVHAAPAALAAPATAAAAAAADDAAGAPPPLPLSEPAKIAACPDCPLVALSHRAQHQLRQLATTGLLDKAALPDALRHSKRGTQHIVSALLEEDMALVHLAASEGDVRARARAMSARGKYAATWLNGVPGVPTPALWLQPPEFAAALRHRLGLPTTEAGKTCGLCRTAIEESASGDHILACLNGGLRTLTHHAISREIYIAASTALMQASLERVLGTSVSTRADIHILNAPDDASWVLDVAVTHPLQKSSARPAAAAAAEPGGAATLYLTEIKLPRYANPIAELNSNPGRTRRYECRPIVVDTFGAWAPHSLETLRAIAARWKSRTGQRLTMLILMHRLSFALMKGLTRMLLTAGSGGACAPPANRVAGPAATAAPRAAPPPPPPPTPAPPALDDDAADDDFLGFPPPRSTRSAAAAPRGSTPGSRVAAPAARTSVSSASAPAAPSGGSRRPAAAGVRDALPASSSRTRSRAGSDAASPVA